MTMKKNKKCCCCCWLMAVLFLLLLLLETGVGGAAVVSSTSSSSAATTSISGSGGISGSSLVMTNQTAVQSVHQQRINRHRQQQQQHQMVVNVRIERTNNCSQIPTIARQLEVHSTVQSTVWLILNKKSVNLLVDEEKRANCYVSKRALYYGGSASTVSHSFSRTYGPLIIIYNEFVH